MNETVRLTRPIRTTLGDTTSELTLREPTIRDIRDIGLPYRMGGMIDSDIIVRWTAQLGRAVLADLNALGVVDYNRMQVAVMNFFNQDEVEEAVVVEPATPSEPIIQNSATATPIMSEPSIIESGMS